MDLTKIKAIIDGQSVDLPEEWQGLQIQASFEEDNVQANIQTESFSFVGTAREVIENHINQGYFYEGLPYELKLNKGNLNYLAFNGYLNLQDSYTKLFTDRVEAQAQKLQGLNTLGEKLSSLTFGYLDSLGVIESKEVEYLVEKRINAVEIVMTSLMIYLMVKEVAELVRKTAENISELIAVVSTGTFTSALAGGALIVAKIALDLAYAGVMVKAIIEMTEELLFQFISPVRRYKTVSYFELMKKAVEHLGYSFSSSITDLQRFHYLPSNPYEDQPNSSGVPSVADAGYNCGEFFNIVTNMFSGQIGIIDGVVYFENKDSDFWIKNSTWTLPSVYPERERKNGEELFGTRVLSYQTDPLDEFTTENIQGTFYEIRTLQSDYKNGEEYLTIKNLDDRVFPFALPNRKDELNRLEKLLKELASIVDDVIKAFGGASNLSASIEDRVGMLKLGTEYPSIARALYLTPALKLPANHRELMSTKRLYDDFIKADSFVLSKNGGQKVVYEDVRVLFGFEDFLQLIENSYFVTDKGGVGKVTNIAWTIDGDFAQISYWIKDPNPTNKLIEEYIEPN